VALGADFKIPMLNFRFSRFRGVAQGLRGNKTKDKSKKTKVKAQGEGRRAQGKNGRRTP
jgi:hypothetical protein